MQHCATSLRRAALTAIALASFAVPMVSVAKADQQAQRTHATITHWRQPGSAHKELIGRAQTWEENRCAWPYRNQFPPCMSTWPAGDPNYHGSRPGPTFND